MDVDRPQPPDLRPGEVALDPDPAGSDDAGLSFIGQLRTPWTRGNCPKNLREARERGGSFTAEIAPPYRPGLLGLQAGQAVILLYWTGAARRDVIVQSPAHRDGPTGSSRCARPRGRTRWPWPWCGSWRLISRRAC